MSNIIDNTTSGEKISFEEWLEKEKLFAEFTGTPDNYFLKIKCPSGHDPIQPNGDGPPSYIYSNTGKTKEHIIESLKSYYRNQKYWKFKEMKKGWFFSEPTYTVKMFPNW